MRPGARQSGSRYSGGGAERDAQGPDDAHVRPPTPQLLLLYVLLSSLELSDMNLKYEPFSEPLHISAK